MEFDLSHIEFEPTVLIDHIEDEGVNFLVSAKPLSRQPSSANLSQTVETVDSPLHIPETVSSPPLDMPTYQPSSLSLPRHSNSRRIRTKVRPSSTSYQPTNYTQEFTKGVRKLIGASTAGVQESWTAFKLQQRCTVSRAPCVKVYVAFCFKQGGAFKELVEKKEYERLGSQGTCGCNTWIIHYKEHNISTL